MFEKRAAVFLYALSPVHMGAGSAIGVIDQTFGQKGGRLANLPALNPPTTFSAAISAILVRVSSDALAICGAKITSRRASSAGCTR